jgi:hypothetical protein
LVAAAWLDRVLPVVHVEAAEEVAGTALELCQPERVG